MPITGWVGAGRLWMWGSRSDPAHGLPKYFDHGKSLDLATGAWSDMPSGGPIPSAALSAVWTGCEALVFDAHTLRGMIFRP